MAQPNSSGLWLIQAPTRRPPFEPPQIAILRRKVNVTNYLDGIFSSMWVQSLVFTVVVCDSTQMDHQISTWYVIPGFKPLSKIELMELSKTAKCFISHLTKRKEMNPLYIKSDSSDSQSVLGRKTSFFSLYGNFRSPVFCIINTWVKEMFVQCGWEMKLRNDPHTC